MKQNNSPWLTQLHHDREVAILEKDMNTDVVIVGGGIAGITTLFFLLKYTNKKIVLVEGGKLAHGATGHNAGYIVAEFEKPLAEIIKEYGMKKAIAGVESVEQAWNLVEEIFQDTGLRKQVPYHELIGYGGYCELEQLLADIETEYLKQEHGLESFPVLISHESGWLDHIPLNMKKICKGIDQEALLRYLETDNKNYYAVIAQKKAVMNSALFSEKLALWCLKQYPDRVHIFEHSFVHGIELDHEQVDIITNNATVITQEVVLCTNGFENFYIHSTQHPQIDEEFHRQVQGAVGYMIGFISEDISLPYMANYYYEQGKKRGSDPFSADPYFYVTRRDFDFGNTKKKLFSLGGPEIQLEDREVYLSDFDVAEKYHNDSDQFIKKHFKDTELHEKFFWHGLMGYTKKGLRIVCRDRHDSRLLYNLGCNGVGILTSIMGSRKIARHVGGEVVPESIFDL